MRTKTMIKPDISKAPKGATHWAPDTDQYIGGWYRIEGDIYHFVNGYWASDVEERPHSKASQRWFKGEGKNTSDIPRPMTDLIPLEQLK